MLGTSFAEWLFIRASIIIFRYTPLLWSAGLGLTYLVLPLSTHRFTLISVLSVLLLSEACFFAFLYYPYQRRLKQEVKYPDSLVTKERRELFEKCIDNVPSLETYLQWWFLGASVESIRRENVREFLCWAFFDQRYEELKENDLDDDGTSTLDELEKYIELIERRLGRNLGEGRGNVESLRLTFDDISTTYRGLAWYTIIFVVDQATHLAMRWHGFQYYARPRTEAIRVFPPRPLEVLSQQRSPARGLSYWYRPHESKTHTPILFFHGIGVGLWTYVRFLADIYRISKRGGQGGTGIIAIELLPISFRLTDPPLEKTMFLQQMTAIVDYHHWQEFTITSHSYGSVLITHALHQPDLSKRIASVVLIDPVTIMLHLPNVAYNFTRRKPKRANEWQLWYFASTDPGVAHCLGRCFFWRENILWKEELGTASSPDGSTTIREPRRGVKASVFLSGQDIIVDAPAIAQYLNSGETIEPGLGGSADGVDVHTFPHLDHAQVFDDSSSCERVVQAILLLAETGDLTA